jgi:hypothetical protein
MLWSFWSPHLYEPLPSVAHMVQISVPILQLTFQQELGISPTFLNLVGHWATGLPHGLPWATSCLKGSTGGHIQVPGRTPCPLRAPTSCWCVCVPVARSNPADHHGRLLTKRNQLIHMSVCLYLLNVGHLMLHFAPRTLAFTCKIVARVDCQRWAYRVWDARVLNCSYFVVHLQLDEFSIIASRSQPQTTIIRKNKERACRNVLPPGGSVITLL